MQSCKWGVRLLIMREITDIELGWLAGILEGEGSFVVVKGKDGYTRFQVVVQMTDEDVINELHRLTGLGTINGPYQRKGRETHKSLWRWQVCYKADIEALCLQILPYMHERRRLQIHRLLSKSNQYWTARLAKRYISECTDGRKKPFQVVVKGEYIGSYGTREEAMKARDEVVGV